jgi:phosphoglycerol transferase MdoB-like AlkP superfamily enzyme
MHHLVGEIVPGTASSPEKPLRSDGAMHYRSASRMESPQPSPLADRFRLLAVLVGILTVQGALQRVFLYARFHDTDFDVAALALCLVAGLLFDILALVACLAPAISFLALLPSGWLRRPRLRAAFLWAFFSSAAFLAAVEYFFFEEFNARFNHIALDYLLFPQEVFTNVWQSYDVPLCIGCSIAAGVALAWIAERLLANARFEPLAWRQRIAFASLALGATAVSVLALSSLPASIVESRVTSETAQNDLVQLVRAFVTSDLDYAAYYRTLPSDEARARAARVLGFPAPVAADGFELQKRVESRRAGGQRPLDVVVVLEESLGSAFIGALGSKKGTSEHFDRWSREGLLLENLVANGNRTVRGLEGVLCSFVPLPGDSITKRPSTEDLATLARVLAARGYATSFLYGGRTIFDGMSAFLTKNGWQEIVEQGDFPSDAFSTAWGVADEWIFDALLERQLRAEKEGKPLFATLLSVSNHKPYRVPQGRAPRADGEPTRDHAVAYADWALGRWLDAAREHHLLEHTVVLVVGDHGARVYGSELIPVESYRIPALFLTPDPEWRGMRIARLCSQVDLAPTLLSLAGVSCTAPFFGSDVTAVSDGPGRAFVHHNRDVGVLTDDLLVVLGLQKTVAFYRRDGRASDALVRVPEEAVTPAMHALELDATAVFQTAYELYRAGKYKLPEPTPR